MNPRLFALVLALYCGAMAHAQDSADHSGSLIEEQLPRSLTIHAGFVFWDGQYQPLPYTLAEYEGGISLNGRPLGEKLPPEQMTLVAISETLKRGDSLVVLPGPSPRFIPTGTASMMFENILAGPGEPISMSDRGGWNPVGVSLCEWNLHFQDMELTAEFRMRAEELIARVGETRSRNDWSQTVSYLFHQCGYVFTVTALVLVTFAVGQLLGSHRLLVSPEASSLDPKTIEWAFSVNLRLIVALAALDLVWTIGAASAGEMTELNPIGSHLIHSPWALAVMKSVSTLIAVSIFHSCRFHPLVRKANWWACTVYMLVGMRWVFLSGAMI